MKEIIGITAALLCFIAYAPYFRDIFAKKTVPHPYSWFVWGFTSVLIFALQTRHGAGAGAYATSTVAVISFIVCILALKNGGHKDITRIDTMLFITAIIAAILWLFVDLPALSIVLLVGADMLGFIPSIRKALHKPYEETLSLWVINGFRHALALFALTSYTIITVLNPLAWCICNLGFAILLVTRRKMKTKAQ